MKKVLIICLSVFIPLISMAQNVVNVGEKHTVTPESHLFATFVKSLPYDLKLTIEEEIRSAPSHRAHTTLGLGYTPIPYLNIYAGYTVMIYGKNAGWDDPNNYIRHRVNVLLTPQIKLGQWSLSLREGLMIDTRTDDIDTRVKSASTLTLRSRLQAVYAIGTTPLSVVAKIEMLNTLNAPVDYLNSIVPETDKYSSCYISELRPEAGLQWKINKQHALTLTYRYNYLYSRDASILDSGDVDLTNSYTTKHLILLAYKLDW